jgi:AraC family transcriptional regulator of adaptative response / DNA-3-methyladenine glycosylase II
LREPDAFPSPDVELRRLNATSEMRVTSTDVLAHANAWRPWRAYAAVYLWTAAHDATDATDAGDENRREIVA